MAMIDGMERIPTRGNGPRIVTIGGGHGLANMLRGLKKYTENLSAIVTVADDGGGSGRLREDLGMLPPGDIRNCMVALANTEPVMRDLLNYRFSEGELAGQSFGNLFLAAMNGLSPSFDVAVRRMSQVTSVSIPEWYDGKKINEVMFCDAFLAVYPMKCIRGQFFTVDGLVDDENMIRMEIYNRIKPFVTSSVAKKQILTIYVLHSRRVLLKL